MNTHMTDIITTIATASLATLLVTNTGCEGQSSTPESTPPVPPEQPPEQSPAPDVRDSSEMSSGASRSNGRDAGNPQQFTLPSQQETEATARRAITEENADEEFEKLQREIEQELDDTSEDESDSG